VPPQITSKKFKSTEPVINQHRINLAMGAVKLLRNILKYTYICMFSEKEFTHRSVY
jgi:hypothetical protein